MPRRSTTRPTNPEAAARSLARTPAAARSLAARLLAATLLASAALVAAPFGPHAGAFGAALASPPGLPVAWHRDVGRSLSLAPALSGDRLVFATSEGRLTCVELSSGRKLWSRNLKAAVEVPPVDALGPDSLPTVLIALGGGRPALRSCSLAKGKTVWQQTLRWPAVQLTARDGRIFLFDARGTLSVRDALDGTEIWTTHFGGWRAPGFLLDGHRVYALARQDSLAAFSAESGARLWSGRPGGLYGAPPRRIDGGLVLLTSDGEIQECDPASGDVRSRNRRTAMQLLLPAPLEDGCVTVSSGGVVEAGPLGADARWSFDMQRAPAAGPAVLGPLVLVSCADGTLLALDAAKGSEVWSLKYDGGLRLPPLTAGGYLLVCTARGEVIAYTYSP